MLPQELETFLVENHIDKISDPKGTPNRLLYVSKFGSAPKVNAELINLLSTKRSNLSRYCRGS